MRTVTITEAKNKLSSLIDRVRSGETILILDRGVPVARLEPTTGDEAHTRLLRLERAGMVRRPTAGPALDWLESTPPGPASGTGAVDNLLEERRSGR